MSYLSIIAVFGILPTVIFLFLARKQIDWWSFGAAEVIIFTIAALMDYTGITGNVWVYGEERILGVRLFRMPLEDYLFFIFIPA